MCIKWEDPKGQQSPALKQLKKPTKVDVPLLKNDLTAWITRNIHRAFPCEMHSFVNKKQWKRIELYKWTVKCGVGRHCITTHVLQCRLENL